MCVQLNGLTCSVCMCVCFGASFKDEAGAQNNTCTSLILIPSESALYCIVILQQARRVLVIVLCVSQFKWSDSQECNETHVTIMHFIKQCNHVLIDSLLLGNFKSKIIAFVLYCIHYTRMSSMHYLNNHASHHPLVH